MMSHATSARLAMAGVKTRGLCFTVRITMKESGCSDSKSTTSPTSTPGTFTGRTTFNSSTIFQRTPQWSVLLTAGSEADDLHRAKSASMGDFTTNGFAPQERVRRRDNFQPITE